VHCIICAWRDALPLQDTLWAIGDSLAVFLRILYLPHVFAKRIDMIGCGANWALNMPFGFGHV